jgi:DNA polymerase III gamma/tau subunit
MLQSLSDLMDHQEQREEAISRSLSLEGSVGDEVPAPIQESSRSQPRTPQRRQLIEALHPRPKIYKQNRDSPPPEPISTPENSQQTSDTNSSLQQVVEQLYGRCQILERERTEMMAVTLDLLESARKANTAELEAALATVRRQAMEDVLRVRQQNTVDQERLYQKLCTDNGFSKATAPTHEPVLDVMSKSVLMVYNE